MSSQLQPSGSAEADRMLSRGQTIGRYVVLGLVGRGGMGEVYAAYDPELDRKVAIKLLHVRGGAGGHSGQGTQDNGRARLLREAQAIAKLSHPNVVVIYDVGAFQDQVFIAMEFVEGQTVGYWMNAAPRAWPDVLKVFVAAGRGLAAAHEKNLVHRDFKPDNVMIDSAGQVHVMDFGLARLAGDRSPEPAPSVKAVLQRLPLAAPSPSDTNPDPTATVVVGASADSAGSISGLSSRSSPSELLSDRLTQTGTLVGTPAYMAPEQFLVRPTDARTDQFSFCVALYEALYGERPFEGSNVFNLTANVVQGNVRVSPPQTKVPPWIRKVLLRGLAVDPKKRWPSLIALLGELERNRADAGRRRFTVGAAAKLAGVWEAPSAGRTRDTAAKLAVRQAFLATGKRYAAATFDKVKRVLDRYAADWTKMYTSICEATHTRGEQSAEVLDLRMAALQDSLQDLRALCQVLRGATAEVVENAVDAASGLPSIDRCADVALLRAVVKPPHDPAVRADVDRLRGHLAEVRTLARVGRLADALKAIVPLEPDVRATGYRPLLAEALLEKGVVHAERRELEAAGRSYEEALWTAEVVRHDEAAAEAATQLVGIAAQQARFELGDVWAKHAETILCRMGGHDRLWGWLFNNLGLMRHIQGRLAEAIDYSQRAIAAKEKAFGPDSADLGSSIGNIAFYLAEQGDLEEAVKRGERAIQILEDALGPEHPRTALFLSNHSETLNQLGRFAEARAVSQRALAIFERETEPDGIFVTCALTALGLAYVDDGLTAEAQPLLERAVNNRERHEADAPARLGEVHFALARALWPIADQRVRAGALAERARKEFAAAIATPALARALDAVDRWLRANQPTTVAATKPDAV